MSKPGYVTTKRRLKRMVRDRGIKEGKISLNVAQQMDDKAQPGMVIRLGGAKLEVMEQ